MSAALPCLHLLLDDPDATMELGRILARAMAGQFMEQDEPARSVYLYGDLGCGKTTLARGFALALPGGECAEVASPSFTLCNMYSTCPPVLHADLYRLAEGASLPEEMEDFLNDDALLLLEWPDRLAGPLRDRNRLDVTLGLYPPECLENLDIPAQPCERKRSAIVTAHGSAGHRLLQVLRPCLESRFPVPAASGITPR